MTEEKLFELVSRSLDDDLDERERAELDRVLATDPALDDERAGAARLKDAVATLADSMEPPAELDRVVAPLCDGPPIEPRRVRPVFRWLGAAAAVVLGVTVTLEIVHRNPQPIIPTIPAGIEADADDEAVFELAPLPSAPADEERPLGATDQLLAEELPETDAPEPEPLEVVGPLPSADQDGADADLALDGGKAAQPELRQVPTGVATDPDAIDKDTTVGRENVDAELDRAAGAAAPSMAAKTAQIAAVEDRQATLRQRGRLEPTNPAVVTIDGAVVWRGTAPGCGEGSWWVRLVIRQGEVVDIEPEAEPKGGDAPVVCRPPQLIGASIGDAADTTLVARIVTGSAAQEKDAAGAASR